MSELTREQSESDQYFKCLQIEKYEHAKAIQERDMAEARVTELEAERDGYKNRKDLAYTERNRVVAALAKCFPSGIARTAIEGWDEEWHGCVYIDLPTGQVSWHYHDSQARLFADLPAYTKPWDGHSTEEKYTRLRALAQQHASLTWTTKPPTEGQWWVRWDGELGTIVEVYQSVDGEWFMDGSQVPHCKIEIFIRVKDLTGELAHDKLEWAGPIPRPSEGAS